MITIPGEWGRSASPVRDLRKKRHVQWRTYFEIKNFKLKKLQQRRKDYERKGNETHRVRTLIIALGLSQYSSTLNDVNSTAGVVVYLQSLERNFKLMHAD
jgi:hypothetical protein